MMKKIVQLIREHKFIEAEEQIDNLIPLIMEKKFLEMKKAVAAKMCEQMGLGPTLPQKRKSDVVEEKEDIEEAQGTYRAGYKYDPVVKKSNDKATSWSQTATKGIDDKPDYAGKKKEIRSLDNTVSSSGKQSDSTHTVIKDKVVRPDTGNGKGGDYDISTSTTYKKTDIKEEELDEARINIVKARIRGGKIQRRKKVSNVPGMTLRGGQLKRMSAAERRRRKLGARKGKMKRKAKLSRSLVKRKRSLQRRKSLGL